MENSHRFQGKAGRRRLLAALGSFSLIVFFAGLFTRKRGVYKPAREDESIECAPKAEEVVSLLTHDGKLVQVRAGVGKPIKRATDDELRDWINHPKS